MKRFKLIAGILLIFLTGAFAGHLSTVYLFKNKLYRQGPPAILHILSQRVSRALRLTPPQQAAFDRVVSQTEAQFRTFRKKHDPEIEKILTHYFEQVDDILRPDQREKFEQIKNRFKCRHSGSRPFSPHHRPGEKKIRQPQKAL